MSAWRPWWTPVLLFALAVAWTWPAALGGQVGLHFDTPGTVWFLSAGPRMGLGLHDPLTGWPDGITYANPDSYTLLVASWLLSWMQAARAHAWLQVLGVFSAAWAAEGFARALGARAPWSLLAGLTFACSGLAANALLEGHVYHVVDPWMPLFAWSWFKATQPGGRAVHGLLAAVFFALTTLTTAYLGIAAAVIALGFCLAGLLGDPRRFPWAANLVAALGVAAFGAWYVAQFRASGVAGLPGYDSASRELFLMGNSTDLAGLLTPVSGVDRYHHAAAPTVSLTALSLALFAPLVLGLGDPRWRALLGTGGAALLLSMGPWLHLGERWIPLPLVAIADLPAADLLRHPRRLAWAWTLCAGALAALVATRLAAQRPRAAGALLAFALVDAFGIIGMPARQGVRPAEPPAAYLEGRGPVLDLYPTEPGLTYELNGWFQGLACGHQAGHGRAIADNCVVTRVAENPRVALGQELIGLLLQGETRRAQEFLKHRRFSAVALHPDFFVEGDRARLQASLARLDREPARSTNGGELVEVYTLPGSAP
ncbi:MAG: hypothetical protein H6741_05480 [Alphaproteobacteria bacterium]|nr:hypothetical protein [Alphaproteobacteria bacterium]MCB9792158.1 hypothetical protein [Alphaproteobacteria bacterium]